MQQGLEEMKNGGAEESGAGDGEDPRPDDPAGDAPAHRGEAARGTDTNDGAGNGVRSADGDAEYGVADKRNSSRGLGREAAEGGEFGNALANVFDNAPATAHGAAAQAEWEEEDN